MKKENQSEKSQNQFKENIIREFEQKEKTKWESKAEEYMNDKDKAKGLLDEAMKKAEDSKKGPIGEIWDKVQLLFEVVRSWLNGEYKEIPKGSIIMIIIGLIYFVVPVDIIPDWIIALGLFDDAVVLGFVIRQLGSDLENYKIWKVSNKSKVG